MHKLRLYVLGCTTDGTMTACSRSLILPIGILMCLVILILNRDLIRKISLTITSRRMSSILQFADRVGVTRLLGAILVVCWSFVIHGCDEDPGNGCPSYHPFEPMKQQLEIPASGGQVVLSKCKHWDGMPIPDRIANRPMDWFDLPREESYYVDMGLGTLRYFIFEEGVLPPEWSVDMDSFDLDACLVSFEENPDGSLKSSIDWLDVRITDKTLEVSAGVNDTGCSRLLSFDYTYYPLGRGRVTFYQPPME